MAYKQQPGRGPINKYGPLQEKGLISPLQQGDRPATDAGGRVRMGNEPKGLERFAGKDAGGAQYKILEARAGRQWDKMKDMEKDESANVYTSSEYQKAREKKKKFEDKQAKVVERRKGKRGLRGARNLAIGAVPVALGAEYKDVPQERYTNINIPKGMNPKDVPAYINSMSGSRISVNQPTDPNTGKPIEGWVNYNMTDQSSFDYDPQSGDVSFTSMPKYTETGDYVYNRKKLTWSAQKASDRVKKIAEFARKNML